MDEEDLFKKLNKTELVSELHKIRRLYNTLSEKQKQFCDCFNVHCVKGCGTCCSHFIPDITMGEAEFLAFGLITEGTDEKVLQLIEETKDKTDHCMFYKEEGEYHCTVYKWRPLICRLFAASAYVGKDGEPLFKRCKWNTDGESPSKEMLLAHKESLVLMSEYGLKVDEITPGNTERILLPDALNQAIMKIRLLMEIEDEKA